jgi:uncharacterized protein
MPKRTRLHIGGEPYDDGGYKPFYLPIEVLSEGVAVLATRGAGKTYTMKVLVEEALKARWPVVVFDPMHAWWGLRSPSVPPVKGAQGFPIAIFGGERADLPLEPEAGSFMADLVISEGLSCIFDIKLWSKTKRRQFVADFSERLLHKNRDPIFVVFEEAHKFAPQMTRDSGDKRMLGAVSDLATEGRGMGIGVGMVTQRSARLNKDLLEEVDNLIILRTQGTNDRNAIRKWITTHELDEETYVPDVLRSLPRLPTGSGWVWSPVLFDEPIRVDIRQALTFDSSATPKSGARRRRPKTVADINLKDIEQRMTETIERAREDDPAFLKKRIRELEKETDEKIRIAADAAYKDGYTTGKDHGAPKEVKVPILDPKLYKTFRTTVDKLWDVTNQISHAVTAAESIVVTAQDAVKRSQEAPAAPAPPPQPKAAPRPVASPSEPSNGKIVKGARRMLESLAQYDPRPMTRPQLATFARLQMGGTFRNYLSELRRRALIVEDDNGLIRLTDQGIAECPPPARPITIQEVQGMWLNVLVSGERRMLEYLLSIYPTEVSRDDLAVASELEMGGTFRNYLSTLRRNGLIAENGKSVRASSELFGEGVKA